MFRATKIAGYIKAMEQRGIDARDLLVGTLIDPKLVANPEYLVSLEQYHAVIANMIKLTRDPGISFALGSLPSLNDYGIVGYAMISANSLRESLDTWFKYSNSLVGSPLRMVDYYDVSPGFEVVISSSSKIGTLHRFETEEFLAHGVKVMRDLTGIEPVFGKVSFSYPAPPHRSLYEESLRCPLEFDAPHIVVRVLKPDLDAPIQTMNEELFGICAEHCRRVMSSLSDTGLLYSRLRSLFLATPDRLPRLEAASEVLGMSVSTLCRQLTESGQSYQAIKDEFRFDLAREYLRSGNMTPKQVAYFLGFASPSTFSRAFKAWAGQTVGQFLKAEASKVNSESDQSSLPTRSASAPIQSGRSFRQGI